jgi:hypothetical protein
MHRFILSIVVVLLPCVLRGQTLGVALNATNLTWTTSGTGGSFGWSAESSTTHDGVSAATSGAIFGSRTSTLQTTVTGPGTLSFWWRNPSSDNYLYLNIGNSNVNFLVSYPSWQQQTIYLGPGSQTIKWVYSIAFSFGDSFQGYLDEVSYIPGATAPIISAQSPNESQIPGLSAAFRVTAGGTPPLHYQWRFNGVEIPGQTNSSCVVSNIQSSDLGDYTVEITNSVGSLVSSNAALEFGDITVWGSPAFNDDLVPPGATNILAIAGAYYFNVALKQDGTLFGWGNSPHGEANIPLDVTNAISVAAGLDYVMALRADETVAAWGANFDGETNIPIGLSNVVAIAAGWESCLALKSDGTLVAWGYGSQTNIPSDATNIVGISCGMATLSSQALKADGTVVLWGSNPSPPANLTNVISVKGGAGHDLALFGDRSVVAWGQNTYGEINVPNNATNVAEISSGGFHSLALLGNGTVVGWGINRFGLTNAPAGLTNVQSIAAGYDHSVAAVDNGPPITSVTVTNARFSPDGFSISLPSQSGHVYVLQYKESLTDSGWQSLPLVAGTGRDLTITDSSPNALQRFYRVLRW